MARVVTGAAEAARELRSRFDRADSAVFFGGAGVSTASGIPDFRSPEGLYNQHFSSNYTPEELLSHEVYAHDPDAFFDFYRTMMCTPGVLSNQAHKKLAELEDAGKLSAVVTQNIDGLHQAAGSRRVYELHGSTHRNICQHCGRVYSQEWVLGTRGVPRCDQCGGAIKPDVVLYGEQLDERVIEASVTAISSCDLLVIGGTSLVVYPAAGLVRYFQGDQLVICNLQPTSQDSGADLVCACDISAVFCW